MQHGHQRPLVGLVAVDGEGQSVEELEREGLEGVLRTAEAALTSLSGSGSAKLRYFASVQATAASLLGESALPQALHG
jgi:hypothetical protein